MSPIQSFIANISWNIFGKIWIQIVYFALSVIITRYLGKNALGLYATLLVIPAFMRLVNSLGLEMALHKVLPELQAEDPSLGQGRFVLQKVLLVRLSSSFLLLAAFFYFLPQYAQWIATPELLNYQGILAIYFLVVGVNSLFTAVLQTYLDYKSVIIGEGINAILNLFFLLFFIQMDAGIQGVLWAYVLSSIANFAYYFFRSRNYFFGEKTPTDLAETRSLAGTLYLVSLISFGLLTQTDVLFMNFFQVADGHIGYYYLATSFGGMLTFVLSGIGALALSLFSDSYTREGEEGLSKIWIWIVGFAVFLTAPIYVFAAIQSEPLITYVYGSAFSEVGKLLTLYVVFLAFQLCLGSEMNGWVLVAVGKKNQVLRVSVEGSLLNVLLDMLWIPDNGEWGAVLATGSTMTFMVFRQLLMVTDVINVRGIFSLIAKFMCLALLALIPCLLVSYMRNTHVLWNAAIYGSTFFFILVWVKPLRQKQLGFLSQWYPSLTPVFGWFSR